MDPFRLVVDKLREGHKGTVNPEIFTRILISRIPLKTYFDRKISRLWYDSPISIVERVISPFCEDFIFTKLRICEVSRK